MRTHIAGVVSSNPARVAIKNPLVRETATSNVHFPSKKFRALSLVSATDQLIAHLFISTAFRFNIVLSLFIPLLIYYLFIIKDMFDEME